MRINKIELKGHGSYRNYTETDVPLGITGVVGIWDEDPQRSNASGKSTLVMSVIYALFGEGEYNRVDELVNDTPIDNEMFVKINFDLNGRNYIIERGRKGTSSFLDFFEEGTRRGDNMKSTQQAIVDVLGMDYDMFTSSVFFEQGNIDKFINVTPEQRRQYIDKVLGLEVWRNASKFASKKAREQETLIKTTTEEIAALTTRIKEISEKLTNKVEIEKSIANNSEKLEEERKELETLQQSKTLISTSETLAKQIQVIDANLITKNSEINDIIRDKERFIKNLNESENALSNFVEEDETVVLNMEKELKELNDKKDGFSSSISAVNSDITKLNTNISNVKNIKRNISEGLCPTCQQPVLKEYVSEQHQHYDNEINEYESSLKDKQKESETLQSQFQDIRKTCSDMFDNITELRTRINNNKLQKQMLESEILNIKNQIDAKKSLEKNYRGTIRDLEIQQNELKNKHVDIQSKIPQGVEEKIENLEESIKNIEKDISYWNIRLGEMNQLEADKENLEKDLNVKKADLNNARKVLYIYNALTTRFLYIAKKKFDKSIIDIQNVSNDIIHQILPEISVDIYVDDSKAKKLIIGFNVDNKPRSYKRLSGGQQTIVNIGLRLGFSKVIKKRAKTNIGFVVLDEPFGVLDEYSKTLVRRMLTLMLDWFEQVIAISHVDSIKEFPNIITVRFSPEKISYIN